MVTMITTWLWFRNNCGQKKPTLTVGRKQGTNSDRPSAHLELHNNTTWLPLLLRMDKSLSATRRCCHLNERALAETTDSVVFLGIRCCQNLSALIYARWVSVAVKKRERDKGGQKEEWDTRVWKQRGRWVGGEWEREKRRCWRAKRLSVCASSALIFIYLQGSYMLLIVAFNFNTKLLAFRNIRKPLLSHPSPSSTWVFSHVTVAACQFISFFSLGPNSCKTVLYIHCKGRNNAAVQICIFPHIIQTYEGTWGRIHYESILTHS